MGSMYLPGLEYLACKGLIHHVHDGGRIINN